MKTCRRGLHQFEGNQCLECKAVHSKAWFLAHPRHVQEWRKKNTYVGHKKNHCEECGFVPVHECQLDVDHTDGNHNNNDINNLRTLCANCHRLKTQLSKDFGHKK